MSFAQATDEFEELRDPPLRYDDVVVELEAGERLERRREVAPDLPEGFAFGRVIGA